MKFPKRYSKGGPFTINADAYYSYVDIDGWRKAFRKYVEANEMDICCGDCLDNIIKTLKEWL